MNTTFDHATADFELCYAISASYAGLETQIFHQKEIHYGGASVVQTTSNVEFSMVDNKIIVTMKEGAAVNGEEEACVWVRKATLVEMM